ncbi:MAG: HD domain-containing protein [Clostridiales bacterium]|nr:HD domain-containing protein [Clostridiales bacterium]
MELKLPERINSILSRLEEGGFVAYAAGGAVRDMLMGREPHDYDIATSARPEDIKRIFKRTIDTGIAHGTVTVVENNIGYEVTTFRRDGEYFDGRHPSSVVFVDDIKEDCMRRDFTINAMMYSPKRGLVDFFGGRQDIEQGIIRCVGDGQKRFSEDALRMLRAVRFSATLNFEIEASTAAAIKKCSNLRRRISNERILSELNKLLISDNPDYIRKLHELGLLVHIIPKLDMCFGAEQRNKYHIYDVGEHIMHTLKNARPDLILRWAALLHDIGKPDTASVDSGGVIHFYGHHRVSRAIADDTLHKLRMDKESIRKILVLIENHDVRVDQAPPAVKRMMAKTGDELFSMLLELQLADNAAKNPEYFEDKKLRIEGVRRTFNEIVTSRQPYRISDLVVNGRDLIKLGYKQGRIISDILKALLNEVIIDPKLNTREYLLQRAKELRAYQKNGHF